MPIYSQSKPIESLSIIGWQAGIWGLGLFLLFNLMGCAHIKAPAKSKVRGVSLESPSQAVDGSIMEDLKAIGADHVSLMPYAFMSSLNSTHIQFNEDQQWWGEREEGLREMIDQAHEQGIHVMLKPHLWIRHGEYTGNIMFTDREKSREWKKSYSSYILFYARLAEEKNVALLCIGTELCSMVEGEREYWSQLVQDVKSVYSGELTYAANWDCYADFPWDIGLDYIGIDAYFPLTEDSEPSLESLKAAWVPWMNSIETLSNSENLPVLFTEFGYRSEANALKEPWLQDRGGTPAEDIQDLGYRAFFETVWKSEWLSGIYIWKWHTAGHLERKDETRFTPQGKKALSTIEEWFKAD